MTQATLDFSPTSRMHAASLDKSDRLKRFIGYLGDGRERTTREIIEATGICAVNSVAAEVRANHVKVDCRCVRRGVFAYRLPAMAHKAA